MAGSTLSPPGVPTWEYEPLASLVQERVEAEQARLANFNGDFLKTVQDGRQY
jgi:hypothetical protein